MTYTEPHWWRLSFDANRDADASFSVEEEINGIRERLMKVPLSLKLHIKETLRL